MAVYRVAHEATLGTWGGIDTPHIQFVQADNRHSAAKRCGLRWDARGISVVHKADIWKFAELIDTGMLISMKQEVQYMCVGGGE